MARGEGGPESGLEVKGSSSPVPFSGLSGLAARVWVCIEGGKSARCRLPSEPVREPPCNEPGEPHAVPSGEEHARTDPACGPSIGLPGAGGKPARTCTGRGRNCICMGSGGGLVDEQDCEP